MEKFIRKGLRANISKYVGLVILELFLVCAHVAAQNQNSPSQQPGPDILSATDPLAFAAKSEDPKIRRDVSSAVLKEEIVEKWSTPSLEGSDLIPIDPLVGQVDDGDSAYSLELTRVQWRPADPIDLFIIKPAGIAKPPIILYLYSYPSDNDRYFQPDFRKFLVKNGFAAVGFVSALTGQRYHSPRPMKEWFVSQLPESLASSVHDVQMILNYLATRGDFDMGRVGMFGEGSGASIAILAAGVDPRIKTLDLVNPWCDWPDWLAKSVGIPERERPDFLKPEFLAAVAPLDPIQWLPKLKSQRIRLRDVKTDSITPELARQKLETVAPPNVEVVRYSDIKGFRNAISGGAAFDWIKQQMQARMEQEYQASGRKQTKSSTDRQK